MKEEADSITGQFFFVLSSRRIEGCSTYYNSKLIKTIKGGITNMNKKQNTSLLIASTILLGTVGVISTPITSEAVSSVKSFNETGTFITKGKVNYFKMGKKEYKLDARSDKFIKHVGLNKTVEIRGQIEKSDDLNITVTKEGVKIEDTTTVVVFSTKAKGVNYATIGATGKFIKVNNKYYFVSPNYSGHSLYSIKDKNTVKSVTLGKTYDVHGMAETINGTSSLEIEKVSKTKDSKPSSFSESGTFMKKTITVVDEKTAKYKKETKYVLSTKNFDYEIAKGGSDYLKKYKSSKTYKVTGQKTATTNNVVITIKTVK